MKNARLRPSLFSLFALTLLLGTVGCANFKTTAADVTPESPVGAMTGKVHGGQQPVAFATLQIWSVGTSGYGSAGTLFATTTSADDGSGSFSFNKQANTDTPYANTGNTWACPASSNPYMYLVAKGGNTQGNHSTSIAYGNTNMFNATDGQQSTVTELVGAAVPVVTPIAAGLANGTIGTKP